MSTTVKCARLRRADIHYCAQNAEALPAARGEQIIINNAAHIYCLLREARVKNPGKRLKSRTEGWETGLSSRKATLCKNAMP